MKNAILLLLFAASISVVLDAHFAMATNIAGCTDIASSGVYYLTADITNTGTSSCIGIYDVNDIILDCQNHIIDSNYVADYGIDIEMTTIQDSNITVRNCVLTNWKTKAVYTYEADNITFESLNVSYNIKYGIYIDCSDDLCSDVHVKDSTFSYNNNSAVYFYTFTVSNISNNSFISNKEAIKLDASSNSNNISRNRFFDNAISSPVATTIRFASSNNNIVQSNDFRRNYDLFSISSSTGTTYSYNNFTDNFDRFSELSTGQEGSANQQVSFSLYPKKVSGSSCASCQYSLSLSPTDSVSYSLSGSNVTGSFTPTKDGI